MEEGQFLPLCESNQFAAGRGADHGLELRSNPRRLGVARCEPGVLDSTPRNGAGRHKQWQNGAKPLTLGIVEAGVEQECLPVQNRFVNDKLPPDAVSRRRPVAARHAFLQGVEHLGVC